MRKQIIRNKLLVLFPILFLLTGCWDQEEIDRKAYVLGIGLDPSEKEGFIKVTFLVSNPEAGSTQQGSSSTEPSQEIITIDSTSIIQAKDLSNAVAAKNLSYDILDFFIVSEELAKNENFLRWFYDATKERDIRRDTKIIVSKEKASEFLKRNNPQLETRQHEYYEIMFDNGNKLGLIPESTINNFFRITEVDADLFISALATTKKEDDKNKMNIDDTLKAGNLKVEGQTNPTQFLGSAVFKEGKMIGTLTVEETRLTQLVNPGMAKTDFLASFRDPFREEFWITARFTQLEDPDIKIDVSQKPPKIDIKLPLHVEVLTDHSMVNYADNEQNRKELKESLKKQFEESFYKFVKRTKEEFKAQPFGFSFIVRKHFLTIPEWEQYDWMKSYPEAEVSINVDIEFGQFGRQTELPDLKKVRD